jgi:hypothetical protein
VRGLGGTVRWMQPGPKRAPILCSSVSYLPAIGLWWRPRLASLPRQLCRCAPCPPALRQVRQLSHTWISSVHLSQAHNSCVGRIVGRAAEELPTAVIRIVGDKKDRRPLEDLARGYRRRIRLIREGPVAQDLSLRGSA